MLLKLKYISRKPTEDELSAIFVICESWSRVLWENAGQRQRWNAQQDSAVSKIGSGSRKNPTRKKEAVVCMGK